MATKQVLQTRRRGVVARAVARSVANAGALAQALVAQALTHVIGSCVECSVECSHACISRSRCSALRSRLTLHKWPGDGAGARCL